MHDGRTADAEIYITLAAEARVMAPRTPCRHHPRRSVAPTVEVAANGNAAP